MKDNIQIHFMYRYIYSSMKNFNIDVMEIVTTAKICFINLAD